MRKEAVYTVLLNAPLFKGMRCNLAQDPRYLRFSVLENGGFTHYNFRVCFLVFFIVQLSHIAIGTEREDRRRAIGGDQLAYSK